MKFSDLQSYCADLKAKFALPGTASPEDQLKPAVAELLKLAGITYGLTVESRTETHLPEHAVRPDIAIYVDGLICGYIELKAPGLGADAPRLKGEHNKKQWAKLKALPNLIYTDGQDWAIYHGGVRPDGQPIVSLHDSPTEEGKAAAKPEDADALQRLLREFLGWTPSVPHGPSALAKYLAPLTRFLRSEVEEALATPDSAVKLLADEWRSFFFPDADNAKFADAYAQTVTYAMLLARLSGAEQLDPAHAAATLDKNNGLLARTLELLGHPDAKKELQVGFELLQRSLESLNVADFEKAKPDLWLYFYEDFLAAYDPKLRKDYGVYYTPREVVEFQVELVSELLEKRFAKKFGFADDGVVFLDPAVGTGTYPVAAVKSGLEKVRARSGEEAVAARAQQMASNMYGFEVLVGPYAVAHLRLTKALEGEGAKIEDRLKIYLADTLESPNATPPGGLTLTYRTLTKEHEAARSLKRGGDVLVCLGNPPYDREKRGEDGTKANKGGWVRFGDKGQGKIDLATGAVVSGDVVERPIFEDFLEPVRNAGKGVYLQVIFNDYVYFWRWALWRLFEQQKSGGIVSFITAASYIMGPGFGGMREVMRRTFDDLWIIDLGGDNLGARKTPNVFAIQIPVAIAIGIRGKTAKSNVPANVWYTKIEADSREAKLASISAIKNFKSLEWSKCDDAWQAPLLPKGVGAYFDWPKLTELFPYHTAGAVFYRPWPIGETAQLLSKRWQKLVHSSTADRGKLFKESRDRKISHIVAADDLPGYGEPAVRDLTTSTSEPNCVRYGFRTLDRHFAFFDFRLGDYIRPTLWRVASDKQTFLISPDSMVPGLGPMVAASSDIPDQHFFRGSFGGKDVLPLYRDAACTEPNVASGLLDVLGAQYDVKPSVEDLAGYAYALLSSSTYSLRYWKELATPGARVPVTKSGELFARVAEHGKHLIWLHTYCERFQDGARGPIVPKGLATTKKGIPSNSANYPETFEYLAAEQEVRVGDGRFGPVSLDVWEYEVSGLKVAQSWLSYRMKRRAGKKSSPLDAIRPESWSASLSDQFLELLWVLEATVEAEPTLKGDLDEVIAGECFVVGELPTPTTADKKLTIDKDEGDDSLPLFDQEHDDD